jgi:Fic family protein
MAHLNLVMIHPFRDGNGRMARALATLVLTRSDIGEPEFCSIEEWLGANTEDY